MPGSRFQAVRQQLHLSIDPYRSGYGRHEKNSASPHSTASPTSSPRAASISTSRASIATSRTSYSTGATCSSSSASDGGEWVIFSVLCLHDFESDDLDHLQFRKNEILDIVKQEATGWWAALRPNDSRVGWIPSAFVVALDGTELQKLQGVRFDLRVFEYDAERLYNSAPISHLHHMYTSSGQSPQSDGRAPVSEGVKVSSIQLVTPTDLVSRRDHSNWNNNGHNELYFTTPEADSPASARFRVPPSPSSPIPHPPLTTAPLLINKPTPPTPTRSSSTSAISTDPSPRELTRSRSDTASTALNGRTLRRRPVLVDDRASLSRLSTLIETNNMTEVEILTSPQMSGSFDAFARQKGRDVEGFAYDDDAMNFYNARLGQSHLPWYLRPSYTSDQLKIDSEGRIKAGTLPALVERLTTDPILNSTLETTFRNVFLMTFRSFASPEAVFDLLVERYQMDHSASLSNEEFEEWKNNKLRPTQKRVLTILTMWLEDHHLLNEEPHMGQSLMDFLSLIVTPAPQALTAKLILQSLERLTFAQPQSPDFAVSTKKRKKSKAYKNDLLKLDPVDIAEQLCLFEHKLYTKIRPQECLNWAKTQSGPSVANLIVFCSTHDKLASWVKMSILNHDVLGKRADVVDFWIKVAEKCRVLNNFASMSAIVSALSSTVITRLHLTWAHVSRKSHMDILLKFNEPSGGFSGYRTLLQSVDGPCVPFIIMFLTDIIHIQDQIPDYLESETHQEPLIYFAKRQRGYDVVSAILRYQTLLYPVSENEPTGNFILGQFRAASTKDQSWFWSKSQEVQQTELAHADIRKGLEAAGF